MLKRRPFLLPVLVDVVGFTLAFAVAELILPRLEQLFETAYRSPSLTALWPSLVASLILLVPVMVIMDGYAVPKHWSSLRVFRFSGLVHALLITLYLVASLLAPELLAPGRKAVFVSSILSMGILWYFRLVWPSLYGRVDRLRRALLVGGHTYAIRALQRFAREHADGFQIIGVVDDFRSAAHFENLDIEHCGTTRTLRTILRTRPVDTLVVLTDQSQYATPIIDVLDEFPTVREVYVRAQVPLAVAQDIDLLFVQEVPLLKVYSTGQKFTGTLWRQVFDRGLAVVGLLMTLPVFVLMWILIPLDSRGPVLYRQRRLGQGNKPFWIYKFRSMVADAEKKSGAVLAQKNDPRVTRLGKIMRALRIDEIPQILNILFGDMSIIGPRPERPEFQNIYAETIPWYSLRSLHKPGLTGLAQVSGDYHTSAQRKLLYDVTYLANMGPVLDLKILAATVMTVLTKKGH
jgi:exopolysaccharide biosynthesis polyprenyl glycosylphosphotransferase